MMESSSFSLIMHLRQLRTRPLALRMSRVFIAKVGGLAAAFALQVMLARELGAEQFGVYSLCVNLAVLVGVVATLGIPTATVRFVSERIMARDLAKLRGLTLWARAIPIVTGLILAAAAHWVLREFNPFERLAHYQDSLVASVLLIPLLALLAVNGGILRGCEKQPTAVAIDLLARPLLLAALVAPFLFSGLDLGVSGAIALTAMSLSLLLFTQQAAIRRSLPEGSANARPVYESRKWLAVALPLVIGLGFETLSERVDIIFLGMFARPSDVGLYQVASRLAGLALFVLASINPVIAPRISVLWAAGDTAGIQRLLDKGIFCSFWITGGVVMALVVVGKPLLRLFGPEFVDGYILLVLLAFAQFVNACAGSVLTVMNMTGMERDSARILAWSSVANLILNYVLVQALGALGAACAATITVLLWNTWAALTVRMRLGLVCHITPSKLRRWR